MPDYSLASEYANARPAGLAAQQVAERTPFVQHALCCVRELESEAVAALWQGLRVEFARDASKPGTVVYTVTVSTLPAAPQRPG